ncbi:helix-turn-helix domain-containing protein [Micromonospora sp. WMMD1082]|nr:helix-turn-helix domain-containing protein [Micromonospora sp. WMMD1082]MDG4794954.1 helix-turn-helix domain-containing protein [Micromonospora sp. WMMD1082]
MAALVRWFWIPEWRIAPGRSSRQHLISFPACNLVVEPHAVGFAGPTTRASHRDLTGTGWAVGALLRPAAVPAFTDDPTALRDSYRSMPLPTLHAVVSGAMTGPGNQQARHRHAVEAFTDLLCETVPAPSPEALLANAMAEIIDTDPAVLTAGDVAGHLHVSVRTLQRLARRYVGLSPVAMIRRRRLQEAADRLRAEPSGSLAEVAAELGYTDHAHLANEFRAALGLTLSGYRREVHRPDLEHGT